MSDLFDRIVRHQIQLERAKAGEGRRITATVRAVDEEVIKIISALPENYTKRQLDRALDRIERLLERYYTTTVQQTLDASAATVVDFETDFATETLENFLTLPDEEVVPSNKSATLSRVKRQTYQGKRLSTWNKTLYRDKYSRIQSEVRNRAVAGEDVDSLVRGVKKAAKKSNSNARAVSDAYVNQAANFSREDVYSQNPEYAEEIVWSSILDSGTTLTCGVRSNKRYNAKTKAPIDHNNEWGGGPGVIHWGCRSMGIPTRADGKTLVNGEFVDWDSGMKTAVGADKGYERGDNRRDNGTRYKIGTSKNKLKNQQVRASTDYETWLRRQPKSFVQDTLGVARAEQFLNGGRSLDTFVVKNGRELTVKELNSKLKSG